ncbi:N-ethylammeline chlorohydrolase [Streptococcus pneumoniae]|nr:N-ethylammeline chlorohydrolase [Streptococcus pneumoniae]
MNLLHFIIENVWCQIEVYKYLLSSKNSPIELESGCLYSMKIKEQTRRLAAGCSKHRFEVVDKTDEVISNIRQGEADVVFEEIFEEYYSAACCQRLASI